MFEDLKLKNPGFLLCILNVKTDLLEVGVKSECWAQLISSPSSSLDTMLSLFHPISNSHKLKIHLDFTYTSYTLRNPQCFKFYYCNNITWHVYTWNVFLTKYFKLLISSFLRSKRICFYCQGRLSWWPIEGRNGRRFYKSLLGNICSVQFFDHLLIAMRPWLTLAVADTGTSRSNKVIHSKPEDGHY
jgi:hypothetical protein